MGRVGLIPTGWVGTPVSQGIHPPRRSKGYERILPILADAQIFRAFRIRWIRVDATLLVPALVGANLEFRHSLLVAFLLPAVPGPLFAARRENGDREV